LPAADCAADTLAIVERLGARRFYTAGRSGGGPHALACAASLADRVLACATIAGVGPFGAPGLNFLDGMGQDNQEEFGAALAGPSQLQGYLERQAQVLAEVTGEQVAAALGDLVSPVDLGALTGEFAAYLATTFRRAVSKGMWGWFDDDLAFTQPWGFAWMTCSPTVHRPANEHGSARRSGRGRQLDPPLLVAANTVREQRQLHSGSAQRAGGRSWPGTLGLTRLADQPQGQRVPVGLALAGLDGCQRG
jgi:pimeloyl-ACP methyl ester carboxylesterase